MDQPTLIFQIVSFVICILFSRMCYSVARKKERNAKLWAVLGFMFPLIALTIILLLSKKEKKIVEPIQESTAPIPAMHNESAASLNDDAFELPKAPRLSGSKTIGWYYIDPMENNTIKGPFLINDLRKEIHDNKLDGTTYVWCDEFEEWTHLSEFSNASLILDADFIE